MSRGLPSTQPMPVLPNSPAVDKVRRTKAPIRGIFGPSQPIAGVVSVASGTALAWFTTPAMLSGADDLFWPSLWQALALLVVPLFSMLENPRNLFRAEHVVVIGPAFWLLLDPIQGRHDMLGVSSADVRQAYIAIGVFAGCAWIGVMGRPWRAPGFFVQAAAQPMSERVLFGIGLLAFTLAFLRFAVPSGFDPVRMFGALLGGRWSAPWGRGNLGGTDSFLDHLSYFGFMLPALTVALSRQAGWSNFRTLFLAAMALVIAAFLAQGGGRRITGTLLGSAVVFWFLTVPRVQVKNLVVVALLVLGIGAVMEFMLDYRNRGVGALFNPEAIDQSSHAKGERVVIRVDDNFLRLSQMVSIFPEEHPYTTWRYLLWVAVRPVPRVLWPDKPLDPGFDLPEFIGSTGASLSSSVVGELIMAGGLLAVALGGWFYGKLGSALSNLLLATTTYSALMLHSMGLMALFVGERSMIELVLMSYGALAWVALVWFLGREASSRTTAMRGSTVSSPSA
jgi:hypothetical protein